MNRLYFSLMIIAIGMLHSCDITHKKLTSEKYLSWYNDPTNELAIAHNKDGVHSFLKYYPLECDAAQCIVDNCLPKEEIKENLNSKDKNLTFKLRYETPEVGLFDYKSVALMPKTERMEYFSFYMKNDIYLITKMGDTVKCNYLLFEHSPPNIPVGYFEIGFHGLTLDQVQSITIYNRALHTEAVIYDFSNKKFKLPQIKI